MVRYWPEGEDIDVAALLPPDGYSTPAAAYRGWARAVARANRERVAHGLRPKYFTARVVRC